ncbi:ZIP family metal transporter [Paenibacillus turpanensis]|uniref:ZIP family metal transporter n=1 Tax=Paenibacillus turpanensis TaxID=2689078 RepID=UPI00140A99F9|nr:hypothetical protein [Paenibacillus turpanensis]
MISSESMRLLTIAFIGSIIGGIGIQIGCVIALLTKRLQNHFQAKMFMMCSGLLSVLIALELIPHALENGNPILAMIGIASGLTLALLVHNLYDNVVIISPPLLADRAFQTSLLLCIAIALHNIPAGAAIGLALNQSVHEAIPIISVMILHSIPEGLLVAVPLIASRKYGTALLFPFLFIGSATGLGVLSGAALLLKYSHVYSFMLSIAIGVIMHLVCYEITRPALKSLGIRKGLLFFGLGGLLSYFGIHFLH